MDWDTALRGFTGMLQREGCRPLTCQAYLADVERLRQVSALPAAVTRTQLGREIARMAAKGLSGRSIARILSAWRRFFCYLQELGQVETTPCHGLKAPKAAKRLPKALPVDCAMQLLDGHAADDSALRLRDHAMFELFYSGGLRLAELAALDVAHLDLAEAAVRVQGKGGKTRLCAVGTQARHALTAWLAVRPAQAGEAALFVGQHGNRLGARQIQKRLAAWALESGIGRHVHPHMLRHSFASHLLQSSGDLRAVQEMLGHANLSSTQIYTALDFQHLARTYDQAHPRAHLAGLDPTSGAKQAGRQIDGQPENKEIEDE